MKRKLLKKVFPPLPTATIKGKSAIFMKQNSSDKKTCDIKDDKSAVSSGSNKINEKTSIFSKQNSSAKKTNNIEIKVERSEITPEHNKTQVYYSAAKTFIMKVSINIELNSDNKTNAQATCYVANCSINTNNKNILKRVNVHIVISPFIGNSKP